MEKRILGKTNVEVTVVNIGGCGIGLADTKEEADQAMELALNYGINMIDVAPTYGKAEKRLKPWMDTHRDKFFLAEKTTKRTYEEAWDELQLSLKMLGVDKFDLYQFHAVSSIKELEQILGPGGAMEAFEEAKQSGIIDYIGITGHDDIRVFIEALHRYDFDTILAPVSIAHEVNPHPENDFYPLLKLAKAKDVGIQAIKSIAQKRWDNKETDQKYKTWYKPLDKKELIRNALWYTLSQDGVSTAPMSCDVKLWPMILEAAEEFEGLSNEQLNQIISSAKSEMRLESLFPH